METFGVQRCRWSCTVRSLRWLLKVKTAGHWELLDRVPAVCAQRAGKQSGFHGTVMHHTSTRAPQSGSGAVLLDSNAVSRKFSGELRRSQRRNQRRATENDGSSTAPRLNLVRPVPTIEGQAPAAEVFAAVGNGKLPMLRCPRPAGLPAFEFRGLAGGWRGLHTA
jgi:hypothetical protein